MCGKTAGGGQSSGCVVDVRVPLETGPRLGPCKPVGNCVNQKTHAAQKRTLPESVPWEEHPHWQYTMLRILSAPARGPSLALVFATIGNFMRNKVVVRWLRIPTASPTKQLSGQQQLHIQWLLLQRLHKCTYPAYVDTACIHKVAAETGHRSPGTLLARGVNQRFGGTQSFLSPAIQASH